MTNSTDNSSSVNRSSVVKILAAVIVLVMIVLMLFPLNLGGPPQQFGSPTAIVGATADGTRVTGADRQYALALLDQLERVLVQLPDQQGSLDRLCWGPDVVSGFRKNPEALWLVLQESRRVGPGASPLTLGSPDPDQRSEQNYGIFNSGRLMSVEDLHPLPTSPIAQILASLSTMQRGAVPISIAAVTADRRSVAFPITQLPRLEQAQLYRALNDFLTIQTAASLSTSAVKVSTPAVERLLAERLQGFSLGVARIDAQRFAGETGEPSDGEIAEQFKRFAAVAQGTVSPENPFGFGYRTGDRVQLEWIALDRAAVRQVVAAEKTPYEWEVETRVAYAKDPAPFAPATRPSSTQPATAPAATTASGGFDAHKQSLINFQIDRAAATRFEEIGRRIRSTLAAEYQAYQVAKSTGAATQPTSVGVAIDRPEYLEKVAAEIAARSKVKPVVVRLSDKLDRAGLQTVAPTLAMMSHVAQPAAGRQALPESAIDYALRAADAVEATTRPAADEATNAAGPTLFQPSEPVTTFDDSSVAVFRVIAAEGDRPATDLAPVRAQVVADWKRAKAQALAVASAQKSADAVRSGTMQVVDIPGAPATAFTLGPIATGTRVPPELGLTPQAFQQFVEAFADHLLGGDLAARPIAALSVPLADRAYVVERRSIQPAWTTPAEFAGVRDAWRSSLGDAMSRARDPQGNPFGLTDVGLGNGWLNVAQIHQRTGWTPVQR